MIAAVGISVLLSGCRIGNTEVVWEKAATGTSKYVFQINERTCDVRQALLYLCNYRNLYGSAYGIDLWEYDYGADSLEQYVKDITIQELSRVICMDLLAEQMQVSLTGDELARAKKAADEYYGSLTDAEIAFMDIRESDVVKAYEEYALAKKLYISLTEGIEEEVSDDEARVIRIQQIYVTDKELADAVKEKLGNGDDFAAVASTYNSASEIETVVARDDLPQEVENIAFNLENGEVSEMVKTDDGYYFIKCLSKLEEQLTEDNKENIRQKRRIALFDDEYQAFVEKAAYHLNDSLWDEISLEDTEEIETDSFFAVYAKYFAR